MNKNFPLIEPEVYSMKRVHWFQKPYFSFHETIWNHSALWLHWLIDQFWELMVEIFSKSKFNHILALRSCGWKGSCSASRSESLEYSPLLWLTPPLLLRRSKLNWLTVFHTSSLHVDTESAGRCVISQGIRNPDHWEAPTSRCYHVHWRSCRGRKLPAKGPEMAPLCPSGLKAAIDWAKAGRHLCSNKTLSINAEIWILYNFHISQNSIFPIFLFQPFTM